jgi:hypothetical protein
MNGRPWLRRGNGTDAPFFSSFANLGIEEGGEGEPVGWMGGQGRGKRVFSLDLFFFSDLCYLIIL